MKQRKQYIGKPPVHEALTQYERRLTAMERAGIEPTHKVTYVNAPPRKFNPDLVPQSGTKLPPSIPTADPARAARGMAIHDNKLYISLLSRDANGNYLDPTVGTILVFNRDGAPANRFHHDLNQEIYLYASPDYIWADSYPFVGVFNPDGTLNETYSYDNNIAVIYGAPWNANRKANKVLSKDGAEPDEVDWSVEYYNTIGAGGSILSTGERLWDSGQGGVYITLSSTGSNFHGALGVDVTSDQWNFLFDSDAPFREVHFNGERRWMLGLFNNSIDPPPTPGNSYISFLGDDFTIDPVLDDPIEVYVVIFYFPYGNGIIPLGNGNYVLGLLNNYRSGAARYGYTDLDYFLNIDSSGATSNYWPAQNIFTNIISASPIDTDTFYISGYEINPDGTPLSIYTHILKYVGETFSIDWYLPEDKYATAMDCDSDGNLYVLTLPITEDPAFTMSEGSWVLKYSDTGELLDQWRVRGQLNF